MIIQNILMWCSLTFAATADSPGELFAEAERLSRSNQKTEAMAKCEAAVAEMDRAHAAGKKISWQGMNGLRFAARLAREEFLDYESAFFFCDKLFELADTDYWKVPARLERALTYRAMADFERAQREYDAIAAADQRQRASGVLPQAEMVYFEMGDEARGRALIVKAVMNQDIHGRERFNSLRKCARDAISRGRRAMALEWYAMLEKLPFNKAEQRARYLSQAWYEMGKIEESRGRTAQAKTYYRRAMELEDGEMRYRARARDALESIEYFE
jgi:tetratricopeptide (TPR) repeat protein